MADSTQALRNAIESFIARRELSPTGSGRAAVGNPSFVPALMRGRSPRLATADRALAFMGAEPVGPAFVREVAALRRPLAMLRPPVGPAFVREVAAFLTVTGVKPPVFGLEAAGDPSFATRLRAGASPCLRTLDRVRAWMAGHATAAERWKSWLAPGRASIPGTRKPGTRPNPPWPISAAGSWKSTSRPIASRARRRSTVAR